MKLGRKTAPVENRPEDWQIAKRKGNRVRYRNRITGAWAPWEKALKPKERTVPVVQEPVLNVNPGPPHTETAWDSMTRDELRKLAAEQKIKGRGTMSKAELVGALQDATRIGV